MCLPPSESHTSIVPVIYLNNLRAALRDLASADFQRRVWLGSTDDEIDSFEEAVSRTFDDSGLAVALDQDRAEPLLGENAVHCLRALRHAVSQVDVRQPVRELVDGDEMAKVRSLAGEAVEALPVGFPCACCGYRTLPAPSPSDEICPVCFWQDDFVDNQDTELHGPNRVRLSEARANFARFGAHEERWVGDVRDPLPQEGPPEPWTESRSKEEV